MNGTSEREALLERGGSSVSSDGEEGAQALAPGGGSGQQLDACERPESAAAGPQNGDDAKLGTKRCSMFEGMGTFSQVCSVLSRTAAGGRGLFAQSYLVFIINALKDVWHEDYGVCFGSAQRRNVSVATLMGAVCGMFVFGLMVDVVGKKNCAVLVSLTTLVGAAAVAVTPPYEPRGREHCELLFDRLAMGLFVIGLGFGGEYPVSASLASEASKQETKRGRDILLTFSMQGRANVASVAVVALMYNTLKHDGVWRASIAMAIIILAWSFVERLISLRRHNAAKQSPAYEAGAPKVDVDTYFVLSYYGRRLVGTALSWFLLDVVFYGNALFAGAILTSAIGDNVKPNMHFAYLLLFAAFAMPGYYAAALMIDQPWLGRKKLQTGGFLALGVLYIYIGIFFSSLQQHAALFIFFYALTFIFSGFGPNTTTYLIPSEVFASPVRGTLHGISAASGKLGAVVGVFVVAWLEESFGSSLVLVLLGSIAFAGAVVTRLCIPDSTAVSLDVEEKQFAEAAAAFARAQPALQQGI